LPLPPDESLLVLLSLPLLEELSLLLLLEPLLPLLLLSLPLLLLLVPLELLVSEEEPAARHTQHQERPSGGCVQMHADTGRWLCEAKRENAASRLLHIPDDVSESELELELLLLACLCFFLRAFLRASASAFFFSSSSLGVKRIHSGTSSGSRYLRLDCVWCGGFVRGEAGEGRPAPVSMCECTDVLCEVAAVGGAAAALKQPGLTGLCSCLLAEGLAR
jgi:hypothetical protein